MTAVSITLIVTKTTYDMNYFLQFTSRTNYPLILDDSQNPSIPSKLGSFLNLGNYVQEYLSSPLIYRDAENSNVSFECLLTYDVLKTVYGGQLVSERVRKAIEEHFPGEVQFFDAIFYYKGEKCNSYSAMNIHNHIECYDMEKSIYTIHPVDRSYKFEKRVVTALPLEEYGIIYNIVRSSFDNQIIVSDMFRKVMKANKTNCMSFTK